jgi:tetratricopeptide (TPR) repeat protein
MEGRYDQAVEYERRAIALRPHFGTAWRTLAAAAGLAGDVVTARQAVTRCLELQPDLTCTWVETYHPIVRVEDRARYIEGLRLGGLR